jgi:hypothetical protein
MASEAAIEEGKYREEAKKLFEQVMQKNSQNEKAISLVLELAVGKVEEIIQRMVCLFNTSIICPRCLTQCRFVYMSLLCWLSEHEVAI